MLFADVSDLEARWHTLDESEAAKAEVLLSDASAILTRLIGEIDISDTDYMQLLKQVCCSMVIRAMSATESDSYGVDSMSMTAGVYSQSWNYNNPTGDLYLTKLEKRLLGITTSYIDSIQPMMRGDHHD